MTQPSLMTTLSHRITTLPHPQPNPPPPPNPLRAFDEPGAPVRTTNTKRGAKNAAAAAAQAALLAALPSTHPSDVFDILPARGLLMPGNDDLSTHLYQYPNRSYQPIPPTPVRRVYGR